MAAAFSGEAEPLETTAPTAGGGPLLSASRTYTAGQGDNRVILSAPGCTNNSVVAASVCEFQNNLPGIGSAVLAVYNVAAGVPNNGQCTVIVNSGWPSPIPIQVCIIYSQQG
jgi:hypothetical protein